MAELRFRYELLDDAHWVRLNKSALERADALLPAMQERHDLRVCGDLYPDDVLRLAILRGLDVLEREMAEPDGDEWPADPRDIDLDSSSGGEEG